MLDKIGRGWEGSVLEVVGAGLGQTEGQGGRAVLGLRERKLSNLMVRHRSQFLLLKRPRDLPSDGLRSSYGALLTVVEMLGQAATI
jgi:hypothetical protein